MTTRYQLQDLTHEALCQAFEKCDEIIRQVAKGNDAVLIDASTYLSGKRELFVDDVHLSAEGSKVLAKFTARSLMMLLSAKQTSHRR